MSLPQNILAILQGAAEQYGANANVLDQMTQLESGGRNVVNTYDSNAQAGHPSAGILQFIPSTFADYSRQARAANPNAWKGVSSDWRDPQAQALATAWAITHGKGSVWSTYQRALSAAKGGPVVPGLGGQSSTPTPQIAPQSTFDWSSVSKDPVIQQILSQGSHPPSSAIQAQGNSSPPVPGGGGNLVGIAASQVGKLASSAAQFLKKNGVSFDSAWCGDFVQGVFKAAGLQPPPARYVPTLLSWAQKNHTFSHSGSAGSQVMFDWNHDGIPDHVGLVESVGGGKLHEIGGNQRTQGGHGVTRDVFNLNDPSILGYVNYRG